MNPSSPLDVTSASMPALLRLLSLLLLAWLAACSGVEEKRIRELLNEKGFGTRAQGQATLESYVGGGDAVVFFLEPTQIAQPGYEQLALLMTPQAVGLDGTIHVPYVGSVPVLGLTERNLETLVQEQLQPLFTQPIKLTARIDNQGKGFYVFGEAVQKGRLPMLRADMTLLEVLATVGTTPLANLGRIQVITPDAQNPLVVEVNYREMVLTGNTTYNVPIHENDIIYVPPTLFGMLTRFIEKLLEPVNVVVRALFGVASVRTSYDYLTGETQFLGGGNQRFFGF